MKRFLISILVLFLIALSVPAMAAGTYMELGDIMMVINCYQAPLYASYETNDHHVIAYVPDGAQVMYIAYTNKGCCVAYENYVGYIDEDYLMPLSDYYSFKLPDGSFAPPNIDSDFYPTNPPSYTSYVPDFPYARMYCYANQQTGTRSGPGTKYTYAGNFPQDLDYTVYYQTKGGSVNWGYIEFTYKNEDYRVYTGVKRLETYTNMPYYDEEYVTVTISESHQTYYGPGYNYAQCEAERVYSGAKVKAFFQENGWAMIEYTQSDGQIHRGWSPAGYWY